MITAIKAILQIAPDPATPVQVSDIGPRLFTWAAVSGFKDAAATLNAGNVRIQYTATDGADAVEILPGGVHILRADPGQILNFEDYWLDVDQANDGVVINFTESDPQSTAFNIEYRLELACVRLLESISATFPGVSVNLGLTADLAQPDNIFVHVPNAVEQGNAGSGQYLCTTQITVSSRIDKDEGDEVAPIAKHVGRVNVVRALFNSGEGFPALLSSMIQGLTVSKIEPGQQISSAIDSDNRRFISTLTLNIPAIGRDFTG